MSTIDEGIVSMKFDNKQFESGVQTSMSTLEKLKRLLKLDGAGKGLGELNAAGKNFSLAGISSGVDAINSKFSALGIIGIGALANIGAAAVNAGAQMAKSLTIDPIMQGFSEYELKMGSIQTILANTARHGTSLRQVTASLDELNTYADKTIYNFGDMTRNIGLFTNAGIKVEDATSMIKGFSNEAAASGTSAQGAAGAAYQLSQALSAGTIRLMDWRSLTNVGMGNKNMQNGIIEIADAMGTFTGRGTDATKATKDFTGSLEKGWLTADVMQNYLKIQAGELSDAQMKSIGLSEKQISAFKKQAQTAEDAATKVRTFTQLIGTLREAVGSSWAETFDLLIGDFDEATKLWTNVNNVLGDMIGASGKARNELLKGWADSGGRADALSGLENIFKGIMSVVKPVSEAFREIFPATTVAQLKALSTTFKEVTAGLKLSGQNAENFKSTFKGLFAVISIAWTIFKGFISAIGEMVGAFTPAGEGILGITGNIGDFLVEVDKAVKSADGFSAVFKTIAKAIKAVLSLFTGVSLGDAVSNFFGDVKGIDISGITGPLKGFLEFFAPFASQIAEGFKFVGSKISEFMKSFDFGDVVSGASLGLLATVALSVAKFVKSLTSITDDSGGILSGFKEIIGGITGSLEAMQASLRAKTLLTIAGAIALLAASAIALSMVDQKKLSSALGAITVMLIQLFGALAIFETLMSGKGFTGITRVAVALVILAVAVNILASAVRKLGTMNWKELIKGLGGVAVLLGLLAGTSRLLEKNAKGMIRTAAGLVILAVAIRILVGAVERLGNLDIEVLVKGLASLGILLLQITIFSNTLGNAKGIVKTAAAMVILGLAINVFAGAIKKLGDLSWEQLGKGLLGMAGALLIVAGAMRAMPKNMLLSSVGLLVVAEALSVLAGVMERLGGMSLKQIGKSLLVLAGSLLIIAVAMRAMSSALPGAAALLIVAGALRVLAPVLKMFSKMSWTEIGKGLLMLAGTLAIFGIAGALLTPVIPTLLLLGAAIALIGAGAMLAGIGIGLIATAMAALAVSGLAGGMAFVAVIKMLIGLLPYFMEQLGLGIVAIARVISESGPTILAAFVAVLSSLITAIWILAPKIVATLVMLVNLMANALVKNVPKLVDAGMKLLIGIVRGVSNNVGKLVDEATTLVVKFAEAIGRNSKRMIDAGIKLVIQLVNGVAEGIRNNQGAMRAAGANLAGAIIDGMTGGLATGAGRVATAAKNMAIHAYNSAKAFLEINSPSRKFKELGFGTGEGMSLGIIASISQVVSSTRRLGSAAVDSMREALSAISNETDFGIDLNPTIKPVVDLSGVSGAGSAISSLLGGSKLRVTADLARSTAAAQNRSLETSTPTAVASTEAKSVQFVQNNYSPKPLSRIELYRQTQNQLKAAKGVFVG